MKYFKDYKEYPKTCAPNDFMGQVQRTVNGKPVSQENINLIIQAIRQGLQLSKKDTLLDIACGNGALTKDLFPEISQYLGVDFSEYLIEVAKKNFEKSPDFEFMVSDAEQYTRSEKKPERFNKVLCYGSFLYFTREAAENTLKLLSERFINVERIYLGNLPDRERAHLFYPPEKDFSELLDDNESQIGIWRSKDQMQELAKKTGWKVEFYNMPKEFYSAHYRYDAILTRP